MVFYIIISPFTSFAYDESFYFQYFRWVFLYSVQPYFLWVFGSFYNAINIGSLSLNLPFYTLGIDNVLIEQFTVKLPLLIAAFVTASSINITLKHFRPELKLQNLPGAIFLLLPITIFDVAIFGNPLIISLMFLALSILCLAKSKARFSSFFLAAAASTYLYPIFFALPFLKVVKRNYGKTEMVIGSIIFIVTLAIGQILPIVISLLTFTPISTTVLAPLFNFRSSVTITSSGYSIYGPYYFLSYFLHINFSTIVIEVIYVLSMLIPVLIFLIFEKRGNIESYILFLFFDSFIFVIFSITATPQYLLAISPFIIYVFYLRNLRGSIGILSLLTLTDIALIFSNNPPLYLFSNLNPVFAYSYKNFMIPYNIAALLSIIYIVLLFSGTIYFIKQIYFNSKYSENNNSKTLKNFKNNIYQRSELIIKKGLILIIVILVITVVVFVPVANNIPKSMYFTTQADSESITQFSGHDNGNEVTYFLNFTNSYSLLNTYSREKGFYCLVIPNVNIKQENYRLQSESILNTHKSKFDDMINASINPVNSTVSEKSITSFNIAAKAFHNGHKEFSNMYSKEINNFNRAKEDIDEQKTTLVKGNKLEVGYAESSYNSYSVEFNSKDIGSYNMTSTNSININPSLIKVDNQIVFIGNFPSNVSISLFFYMPNNVPNYVIFEHPAFLIIGFSFLVISTASLVYVIKKFLIED